MQDKAKLVTVTRADITPGQQAVQAAHSAIDFCFEHPSRAGPWHLSSNTVAFLSVPTEKELYKLARLCDRHHLRYTLFREPDMDNQATSICIEPSSITQKLTKHFPLLLKSYQDETA